MYHLTRRALTLSAVFLLSALPISAHAAETTNSVATPDTTGTHNASETVNDTEAADTPSETDTDADQCHVIGETDGKEDARFSAVGTCDNFLSTLNVEHISGNVESGTEEYTLSVTDMTGSITTRIKDFYNVQSVEVNGQKLPLNQNGSFDDRNVYTFTFNAGETPHVKIHYGTLTTWTKDNSTIPDDIIIKALPKGDNPTLTLNKTAENTNGLTTLIYAFTLTNVKPHALIHLPNSISLNADLSGYDNAYKIGDNEQLFYRVQLDGAGHGTLRVTLSPEVSGTDTARTLKVTGTRTSADASITLTRNPAENGAELSADYTIQTTDTTGALKVTLGENNREVTSVNLVSPDGTVTPLTPSEETYTLPGDTPTTTIRVTYADGKYYSKRTIKDTNGLFSAYGRFSDESRINVTATPIKEDLTRGTTYTVTLSDYTHEPTVYLKKLDKVFSLDQLLGNLEAPLELNGEHYILNYDNNKPLIIRHIETQYCDAQVNGKSAFTHVWTSNCEDPKLSVTMKTVSDTEGEWTEYTFTTTENGPELLLDAAGVEKVKVTHKGAALTAQKGQEIRSYYTVQGDSTSNTVTLRVLTTPAAAPNSAEKETQPSYIVFPIGHTENMWTGNGSAGLGSAGRSSNVDGSAGLTLTDSHSHAQNHVNAQNGASTSTGSATLKTAASPAQTSSTQVATPRNLKPSLARTGAANSLLGLTTAGLLTLGSVLTQAKRRNRSTQATS